MGVFDGVLICTDLDGTLLKDDKTVSKENLDAIEYFKQNGGIFTFVTGRMPYYVGDTLACVKPNAPIGCVNGGGLFDYANQKYLWTYPIERDVLELVEYTDKHFPDIGIQVCTFDKTYFCKENLTMKAFRLITGLPNHTAYYYDVKEPIAKILFGSDKAEELEKINDMLLHHSLGNKFDFISSEKRLLEILPKGIGKGKSIEKLCEFLSIDINKTVAVGDYSNDISMFNASKVGIAVSNANEAAKSAADFITVSNEEHAIARVISDIEKGMYL